MTDRGDRVINISSFDSRHAKIKELMTCPICKKFLREVTAIDECLHVFCRECITERFSEERVQTCPVCNVDLGVFPLQKLRADFRWQSLRNNIKFKRRQLIDRGLIQKKPRKPQTSEEANQPEVEANQPEVEANQPEVEANQPEAEANQPEVLPSAALPVGRREKSPVRRKEKSISSVLRAEKAYNTNRPSPANGGRKSGGRKANPPRRTSLSSLPPIRETEESHESPSNSVKIGHGEQRRKQTIKRSNQELPIDNKRQRTQRLEGMNAYLKPRDCLIRGAGTSGHASMAAMQQGAAPSEARGNIVYEDKGKSKEHTNNSRDQYDETRSVSVPSRSGRPRNGSRAQEIYEDKGKGKEHTNNSRDQYVETRSVSVASRSGRPRNGSRAQEIYEDKGKGKEHTNNSRDQYVETRSVSVPSRSGRSRNGSRAQEIHEDKGKGMEHTINSRDQYDETGSVSFPSRSGRPRNVSRAQEKRPVVTEDLNLPAQVYLDASSSKCFRSNHIWFSLVASDQQQTYVPLRPLPPYCLMVKDPTMPASFLQKYLVKKLRLYSEDEVELSMRGKPISPDTPLEKLVDMWMQTTPIYEQKPGLVGDSAKDFVMVVTYGRNTVLPF